MAILPIGLTLLSAFFHASWNFLARESNETDFLLHSGFVIIGLGLIPAIILEFIGTAFPLRVWLYVPISGTFLAVYYLGIIQGYRSGDFTVGYPVARDKLCGGAAPIQYCYRSAASICSTTRTGSQTAFISRGDHYFGCCFDLYLHDKTDTA